MTGNDPGYTVNTTETSLAILEAIRELDGARLTELVDRLGLAKSTVHKHLITLEKNGFLLKEGDVYYIGLKFLNYGEYARTRGPAFNLIKEMIGDLTKRTDEEVDFVAEDHGRILTICESYHKWVKYRDERNRDDSNLYRARIGTYYRMHATASGKAILGEYPTYRVEEIIDQWGLPSKTSNTITSTNDLFAELDQIQKRGFAVDDEEFTDGLRSVGKAVTLPNGNVLGAFSVSGPTYRMNGPVLNEEIPEALMDMVEHLEDEIESIGAY